MNEVEYYVQHSINLGIVLRTPSVEWMTFFVSVEREKMLIGPKIESYLSECPLGNL